MSAQTKLRGMCLTVVHGLTAAAISTGEMNCDDEGYMRDLDESKVDAILDICGKGPRAKLYDAIKRSQKNAHKTSLKLD